MLGEILLRRVKDAAPVGLRQRYYRIRNHMAQARQSDIKAIRAIVDNLCGETFDAYWRRTKGSLTEFTEPPVDFPIIEINNSCNLNCVMCRTQESERIKQLMDPDEFEKVIAIMVKGGGRSANLHSIGDPLVNKNLKHYLTVMRKYRVSISHLSSNCQFLHSHIDTILSYRDVIDCLRPSVDAATKATYEEIRDGASWERLHENLLLFKRENDKLSVPLNVGFSHCLSKANFHEIAFAPQVFSYIAAETSHSLSFATWKGESRKDIEKYNYFKGQLHPSLPCSQLWETISVLADGRLSACCGDFEGDLTFGDMGKDSPREAFNGEMLRSFRRAHLSGDLEAMPSLCRDCEIPDPRYAQLLNGVFQWYFAKVRKHPVYLQRALNEIGPLLQSQQPEKIWPAIVALGAK